MHLIWWKARRVKNVHGFKANPYWEVRRTGEGWHIHTSKYLFKAIYRCLTWKKRGTGERYEGHRN